MVARHMHFRLVTSMSPVIRPQPGRPITACPFTAAGLSIPTLNFWRNFIAEVDIDAVLRQADITRHEVEDPGHWFTQRQADSFHETLVATGNPNIAREAGRFTVFRAGRGSQTICAGVDRSGFNLHENRKTCGSDIPGCHNDDPETGVQ